MKNHWYKLGLVVAVAGLSLSLNSVVAAEFTFRFAHILKTDTPAHRAAERMAELVAERSDGRIRINIHPAGELGTDTEIIEQIQFNSVQIGFPPTAVLGQFEPRMQLFDLPFIFPRPQDAYTVLDGDVGQELLTSLEDKGFKGLAYWESGFKQITSKGRAVLEPSDLEGMAVRTMDSPLLIQQYRAWGANPLPISFAETYTALQQGVADAQENPLVSIHQMRFYEVQDHLTLSNHAYLGYALIMNKSAWDNLPEDLQQVIAQAAKEARDWQREESHRFNDELIEKLRGTGIEVHELADEGRQKFVEASRSIHEAFESVVTPELLKRVYDATGQGG
jgi:C4-dicarboxylate-binding protein DctP